MQIIRFFLSTDQVWERGVGGRLGAIRDEE